MLISRVEPAKNRKGKVRIVLEDGTCLALYASEARGLPSEPGAELTEEQYQAVLQEVLLPRAKRYAMHLLEQMDRTERQLRDKLRDKDYPEAAIDGAVAYVEGYHYVDDFRYACNYVRGHAQTRSRAQLSQELLARGVSRDNIARALDAEYLDADEGEKIQAWLEKKHYDAGTADAKETRRMYQFLLRRGFQADEVMRALRIP